MKKDLYNIGEVAKIYHLNSDTIRYYEEIGLISPYRAPNGYRMFSDLDISNLDIIYDLRKLGFSLDEIGEYFKNRSLDSSLAFLNKELEIIREQISSLRKMEKQVYSRINNLTGLSYKVTDICLTVTLPDRNCLRYPLRSENEIDYLTAARKIQEELPDSQYILGNMNVGREMDVSHDENGCIQSKFKSVIIIDNSGNSTLKGGTYISLVFRGGSKMAASKFKDIEKYAKENNYVIDGDPILLILTDSHDHVDSSLWLDELQVKVRQAE